MYTGLIDHCGEIIAINKAAHSLALTISCQFDEFQLGESIAIDGMCVTVTDFAKHQFSCQLSPETLRLTIAADYKVGDKVNLEKTLCLKDALGGHMVTGHIDATAVCAAINEQEGFYKITLSGVQPKDMPLLTPKGSVAVNGVSLTLNQILDDGFELMLIPHTLQVTNISALTIGDRVNLEFDQFAKMIQHQLQLREERYGQYQTSIK